MEKKKKLLVTAFALISMSSPLVQTSQVVFAEENYIVSNSDSNEVVNDGEFEISDRSADNPGTNYWVDNRPKKPGKVHKGDDGWAEHLANEIAECIAWGISGQRGPFGCGP